MHAQFFKENFKLKGHLRDLDTDGKMKLNKEKKQDVRTCPGSG
jgi:hypothetical protein